MYASQILKPHWAFITEVLAMRHALFTRRLSKQLHCNKLNLWRCDRYAIEVLPVAFQRLTYSDNKRGS